LDSIRSQDFSSYEIIVADAHSNDRTRETAVNYGCTVVDGGRPAAGRNAGAKAANGDYIFFLDADVILPPGFISNIFKEMQDRYIELATCEIKPLSDFRLDRIIHRMMNLAILLNLRIDPKAFGFCIFVTKQLFNKAGGFDETIYVAEDNDFVKRASSFSALRYLNSAHIMVSIRRFEKEGRFAYMKKGIKLNLYRSFKGEIRNDEVVKYEFNAFEQTNEDNNILDKIEKMLLRIEEKTRNASSQIKSPEPAAEAKDDLRKQPVCYSIETAVAEAKAERYSIEEMQPPLDEYAHLVEELDAYLSRKERYQQKQQKMKDFFKLRTASQE
jgi:glycosyltransferase involved in cell wall biosynthesis